MFVCVISSIHFKRKKKCNNFWGFIYLKGKIEIEIENEKEKVSFLENGFAGWDLVFM